MFQRFGNAALVAPLLVAGCGGDEASSPPTAEPVTSRTAPTSVPSTTAAVEVTTAESTVPTTTEPLLTTTTPPSPPSSTVPAEPPEEPLPVTEAAIYGVPLDLGVLPGGTKSFAGDINDSGVIVGFSFVGTFEQHAVWWPDATTDPQLLSELFELRFDDQQSLANEINNAGQILVVAKPQAFVVGSQYRLRD